ncbi:hypothetical protein F7725_024533, partial [Dissostichus mawsoni]
MVDVQCKGVSARPQIRTPFFMMSSQTWCCISVQAAAVLLKPLSDWLWTSQVKRSKGHCGPQAAVEPAAATGGSSS